MNRFCRTHSDRGSSRAYRMILARHSYDDAAQQQVVDEHGDCADCWHDTALAAVDAAHSLLLRYAPLPGMDDSGVVTGSSVDLLLGRIDALLECERLDRRGT
jgi:hypothetical protein